MRTRWEARVAPGPASVLDIGDEVGAMVVYLATDTPSGELEACPRDEPEARFHTGVHHRPVDDGSAWVAVFPEVAEGHYFLLDTHRLPMASIAVGGGRVEVVDLR